MSDNNFQVIHYNKGEIPDKKYGQLSQVQASFICANPPGVYPEPENSVVEERIAIITEWADGHNYPETHCSKKYEQIAKTGAICGVYFAPTLEQKQSIALGKLATWVFLMDDAVDNLTENSLDSYNQVSNDFQVFLRIFEGQLIIGPNGSGLPIQESTLIHFVELAAMAQCIYQSLMEAIPNFHENKQYFIEAMNDHLHSFLWRYQRDDKNKIPEQSYLYFRGHHGFSYVGFEILALLHGIEWNQLDRSNIEFKYWRTSVATTTVLANDVLSLRKEITDNETENLIIHKHLETNMEITKSLALTINQTNLLTHEVKVYGKRLLDRAPNDEMLQKLIQVESLMIDGHLYFYGYTKRYGDMERTVKIITEDEYKGILYGQDFEVTVIKVDDKRQSAFVEIN